MSPYDAQPEVTHGYTVEQLDHANRWQIIKHVGTSAEAQVLMEHYLKRSRSTAWRVVEHPSLVLKWDDGQEGVIHHDDMKDVSRVKVAA